MSVFVICYMMDAPSYRLHTKISLSAILFFLSGSVCAKKNVRINVKSDNKYIFIYSNDSLTKYYRDFSNE